MEWSAIGSFKTSADARVQTYFPELADKNYGNGIIGPSAEDLARWGKPNEAVLPREEELAPVA